MGKYANFYNSNNGDRVYDSEAFAEYFKPFFVSGIFNGQMQVIANDDMTVTVKTGNAYINGRMKYFDADTTLQLEQANASLGRIDNIVVRRDDVERDFTIEVVKGTPSTTPVAPSPQRDSTVYELVIAQVAIAPSSIKITQANITDTRMQSSICGWVCATVTQIDFDQIVSQWNTYMAEFEQSNFESFTTWETTTKNDFDSWYEHIKGQLSEDAAGHLQEEVDGLHDIVSNCGMESASGEEVIITLPNVDINASSFIVNGKTTQAGSGDPSPSNVRAINGVGKYDKCIVLKGTETIYRDNTYGFLFPSTDAYKTTNADSSKSFENSSHYKSCSWNAASITDKRVFTWLGGDYLCIKDSSYSNVADFKAYLAKQYENGTPVTLWYTSRNYAQATTFYTVEETTGVDGSYNAKAVQLDSPLYDGDSVDFVSGEVKRTKGYIQSYNGESIPGAYISSTGGLNTGSQIVYDLATPITETTTGTTIPITTGDTITAENIFACEYGDGLTSALDSKLDKVNVVNNLITSTEGYALDARQGRSLDVRLTETNKTVTKNTENIASLQSNLPLKMCFYDFDVPSGSSNLGTPVRQLGIESASDIAYCVANSIGTGSVVNCLGVHINVGQNVLHVPFTAAAGSGAKVRITAFVRV